MCKNVLKKYMTLIVVVSSYLIASNIEPVKNFNSYPLAKEATSISRGGTLNDKSANEDGIGTVLVGGIGSETNDINNKTYNQALKQNSSTLSDTTNLKDLTIDNSIVNSMNNNKFVKLNNVNGTTCNDNDDNTLNDKYTNGISHLKYNCSPSNRYLYNSYPYNSIRSSMVSAGYNDENYVIFNRNGYYNNCGIKLSTNATTHEFELYFR